MRGQRRACICRVWNLVASLAICLICAGANAAVTVIGVQYQQDELFPEYNCIWHDKYYPTSCSGTYLGGNVHVYLKNPGGSGVTIGDVTLAGYSLTTILPVNVAAHNANSIYFYWDNPPSDILAAGTPVWFKGDPSTIPAGGVAQAVIRLRSPPTTSTASVGVVTSGGTVNATIPIDANAAQLASVGFSQDRSKVYLHWRRSGGAAPTTVKMDDIDVSATTSTVGDPSVNYAVSVINLAAPLPYLSYHVFQGIYADGKTATGSLRAWSHQFLHASWGTFSCPDGDTVCGQTFVQDAFNRGFNAVQNQMDGGGVADFLGSSSGKSWMESHGYGIIAWNKNYDNPIMTFINDEIDAEEDNVSQNFCGTGKKLLCGASPMGILGIRSIAVGEDFRSTYPTAPTTINMNGTFKPENYYAYGQLVDVLQVDPYYQKRLKDTYWFHNPEWIPLYNKATYNYAVAKAVTRAAEPNSSHVILQSCESREDVNGVTETWPFPTPESKRIEVYYTLAGGAKGISYWWFKPGYPSNGLGDQSKPAARALWKEMGVYGSEIKTVSPLLVTSHPVDMALAPSTNVWARALASGTDTIILLAVNDDYYNDETGCHYTPVTNATVTATLPTWMRQSPTAFEITPSGLANVTTSLNGSQLQVDLGTLNLTRMIVVTTNPQLRAMIQQRYEQEVRPGICAFAPEYCTAQNNPPGIVQHPSDQTVVPGGAATFTVVAVGSSPLSYQWQKNGVDLANGGHYSGVATVTLTVSNADAGDTADYCCVVTNPYGTATSNAASLILGTPTGPTIIQQPSNQSVIPGGMISFSVVATGSAPLSYQWQKNQTNLASGGHYSGVTTATLTISGADAGDEAEYRCVVTNPYGSATSDTGTLTVASCAPLNLVNGGFEDAGTGGVGNGWTAYTRPDVPSTVVYTIQTASPAEGLQYQQIQTSYVASGGAGVYQVVNGTIGGAVYRIQGSFRTNSTYGRATVRCAPYGSTLYSDAIDLTPAATTMNTAWALFDGTVTATGASITLFLDCQTYVAGSTAKAAAFDGLTVTCVMTGAPTIVQHPVVQSVCPGATATFSVIAGGDIPLSYQWQKNNVNLDNGGHYSGATTTALTVSNADVADVANYRCVASNAGGNATSNAASLTLKSATTITQQPVNQTVAQGATATFTVIAGGTAPLLYQWRKNDVNLANVGHYSGVTTATLTITGADSADAAGYKCVVTGGCGVATSNAATLAINVQTAPQVTAAVSRKIHGAAGSFDIDVFAANVVECRSGGPTTIVVTFDQPIQRATGTAADVIVSSGSITGLVISGNQLTITMNGVLDVADLAMMFPGIVNAGGRVSPGTMCFGVLLGDVSGDRSVNVFDLLNARNNLNKPVGNSTFRSDITVDGTINVLDLLAVKNSLNRVISGACP